MHSFLLFLFCVFISGIKPAVIYDDQVQIVGHEGKCYNKEATIFYNKGDILRNEDNECVQKKCLGFLQETKKLRVEILTCPAVEAGPGCSIVQDKTKPYPQCCPKIVSSPSGLTKSCEPENSRSNDFQPSTHVRTSMH